MYSFLLYLYYMIVAILSDTHDNLATLEKVLGYINKNKIEHIIHCGDMCSYDTLMYFVEHFNGYLYYAFGNGVLHPEVIKAYCSKDDHISVFEKIGDILLDSLHIGFTHYPEEARKLAETEEYDMVYYGHTHKPWMEEINNTLVSNPGTCGGVFYKATFATMDTKTKKHKLHLIETL